MAEVVFSAKSRQGLRAAITDLVSGLKMGPLWRSFAWDEIQNRYRRSVLGLAWIGLSYLFFVVVITIFFRRLGGTGDYSFLVHVALGYATFTFLVGNITDGCDVFRSAKNWIKSTSLPYSIYVYKSLFRSLFTFAVQITIALGIMIFIRWQWNWSALMAIPAVLVFIINAVPIQIIMGLFATRYRDLNHLVGTITRILFFTTPILWTLDSTVGGVRRFATFNPLTHYIEIFRAPLMGMEPLPQSWSIVIILTLVNWVIAMLASSTMSRRLPFWL